MLKKKSEEAVQPKPQDKPKPSEPIITQPIEIVDHTGFEDIDY